MGNKCCSGPLCHNRKIHSFNTESQTMPISDANILKSDIKIQPRRL